MFNVLSFICIFKKNENFRKVYILKVTYKYKIMWMNYIRNRLFTEAEN